MALRKSIPASTIPSQMLVVFPTAATGKRPENTSPLDLSKKDCQNKFFHAITSAYIRKGGLQNEKKKSIC